MNLPGFTAEFRYTEEPGKPHMTLRYAVKSK